MKRNRNQLLLNLALSKDEDVSIDKENDTNFNNLNEDESESKKLKLRPAGSYKLRNDSDTKYESDEPSGHLKDVEPENKFDYNIAIAILDRSAPTPQWERQAASVDDVHPKDVESESVLDNNNAEAVLDQSAPIPQWERQAASDDDGHPKNVEPESVFDNNNAEAIPDQSVLNPQTDKPAASDDDFVEDSDDSVKDPDYVKCHRVAKRVLWRESLSVDASTQISRRGSSPSILPTQQEIFPNVGPGENFSNNLKNVVSSTSCSSSSSSSSDSSSSSSSRSSSTSSNSSTSTISTANEPSSSVANAEHGTRQEPPTENTNIGNQALPAKKGKKRLSRKEEWLSNKAKKDRNLGLSYVSRAKSHKQIPARSMKAPCDNNKCKLKCTEKITFLERQQKFDAYWQLGDIEAQRHFIHKNMKPVNPIIRFTGKTKPRRLNSAFFFTVNGITIRVCKHFFRATLGINDRVIRTVIKKNEDGFLEKDRRGQHVHAALVDHKKVDNILKQGARDHINSIPRMESHYLRKNTSREYIDGGKSLAELYRDYQALCKTRKVEYVNETMYSRIFNTEFNISFFTPKKDQCELCSSYELAVDKAKEDLEEKYLKHLEEKEESRKEKKRDKENISSDCIVAVYDLQAVLQLPRGNTSVFYYKSKLNNLNLTVSELGTDTTECYFWHEGEASRGADEIGSCVLRYIEKKMELYDGPGVDFIFYSDNCCGQNKNRFIVTLYAYCLKKYPKIKSITHKYLITGHTQNEGDAVHSTIEKQIERRLKSGSIYVPYQYIELIKSAKKKGNPYNVNEMSTSDFVSLKSLADDMGITTKQLKISEIKIFKLVQGEPTKLYFKKSFLEEDFVETVLTRKKQLTQIILKPAYRCKPKIKKNKIDDLLGLIRTSHIPRFYETFYESLNR